MPDAPPSVQVRAQLFQRRGAARPGTDGGDYAARPRRRPHLHTMHFVPGLVALLGSLSLTAPTDWPQYLGPHRDATAPALDTEFD